MKVSHHWHHLITFHPFHREFLSTSFVDAMIRVESAMCLDQFLARNACYTLKSVNVLCIMS